MERAGNLPQLTTLTWLPSSTRPPRVSAATSGLSPGMSHYEPSASGGVPQPREARSTSTAGPQWHVHYLLREQSKLKAFPGFACHIQPLNNILSLLPTNRTYEWIAIGGDSYPGTTFLNHLMRYEQDPECKMLVLLGKVGVRGI